MPAFGKSGGGGRRISGRVAAPLPAVLSTRTFTSSAVVEDISCTGIRVRGENLPPAGDDVLIDVEKLKVFGRVVWSNEAACGVAFDEPLTRGQFLRIEKALGPHVRGLSVEERMALSDWMSGFAR